MTTGSQTWLDLWKTRAQAKRDWVSQRMSTPPASPAQALRRQQFLQRTTNALETRKKWATAYQEHVSQLHQMLKGGAVSSTSESSGATGELEES